MFRLSLRSEPGDTTSISLAGTLDSASTAELRSACEPALNDRQALRIDLSEVEFADEPALALLRDLERQGVELANLPLLLRTQLDNQR